MTKVFKRWMILKGIVGSRYRLIIKTNTGALWKVFFRWDDTILEDLIRAAYDKACRHKVHRIDAQVKEETCATKVYVIDEAWRRYLSTWESEDFLAWSSQATANRNTEVEGPGPDPRSTMTPPTVNELYLHLHTVNHDRMTFIDTRSERFYLQRRCRELTCATPDQSVNDEAVYLNVAGECPKGRVYGLGSLGRKKRRYADPGASTSEMPDMVPRAEFNVVAEQLRKVMEFMQEDLGMNMDGAAYLKNNHHHHQAPPPHDQEHCRK
ncbi:hypothetical protein Sjap_018657 [Stephania japonica]|uniref:Transposase n=1 Tax=Stephania japonica TaxID=461633 RepID=A0AAP0I8E4_9MAGN